MNEPRPQEIKDQNMFVRFYTRGTDLRDYPRRFIYERSATNIHDTGHWRILSHQQLMNKRFLC